MKSAKLANKSRRGRENLMALARNGSRHRGYREIFVAVLTGIGILLAPNSSALAKAETPGGPDWASASDQGSCAGEFLDPGIVRDAEGAYIGYGGKNICTEPVPYTLTVDLEQDIGGGIFIEVDSSFGSGVSSAPAVFGSSPRCNSVSIGYLYRVHIVGEIRGQRLDQYSSPAIFLYCDF